MTAVSVTIRDYQVSGINFIEDAKYSRKIPCKVECFLGCK